MVLPRTAGHHDGTRVVYAQCLKQLGSEQQIGLNQGNDVSSPVLAAEKACEMKRHVRTPARDCLDPRISVGRGGHNLASDRFERRDAILATGRCPKRQDVPSGAPEFAYQLQAGEAGRASNQCPSGRNR